MLNKKCPHCGDLIKVTGYLRHAEACVNWTAEQRREAYERRQDYDHHKNRLKAKQSYAAAVRATQTTANGKHWVEPSKRVSITISLDLAALRLLLNDERLFASLAIDRVEVR